MSGDMQLLDKFWDVFQALQNIPSSSRHLWFLAWVLTGVMLFYYVPLLKFAGSDRQKTEPAASPIQSARVDNSQSRRSGVNAAPVQANHAAADKIVSAPVQIADSKVEKATSAPIDALNANSENVISGPVQVENLSTNSSGDVQAAIGSNVQAPKRLTTGLYLQNVGGTVNIHIDGSSASLEKTPIRITDGVGDSIRGSADIEIYTLFNSASWAYKSSSKLLTYKDQEVTLEEFLVSDGFMAEVKTYQAIVCLGLASGAARGELAQTVALSDERATHLCGLVSRKIYASSGNTKVFGLPLGYHSKTVMAQTREEKQQRSVVILGIKATSGSLESEDEQHRIIAEILKNDGLENFRSSDYSEVKSGKPLRYLRIERGLYTQQ